jgi:hypothetical protein
MPKLEEVFRLSGVPTHTFVEPDQYNEVKVSLRTPGRCLVIEGPSGIGKTTTVTKALAELNLTAALVLSARRNEDVQLIEELPAMKDTRRAGFRADYFTSKYDFALSFAGADRPIAERLSQLLKEREVEVFYDWDLQSLILGKDLEDYLGPIYRSEARYVVPLLSTNYPHRLWTKFESDQFKDRFGTNSVFPINFRDVASGFFTDDQKYGALKFDRAADVEEQLKVIANVLCDRLIRDREGTDE